MSMCLVVDKKPVFVFTEGHATDFKTVFLSIIGTNNYYTYYCVYTIYILSYIAYN